MKYLLALFQKGKKLPKEEEVAGVHPQLQETKVCATWAAIDAYVPGSAFTTEEAPPFEFVAEVGV